MAKYEPKLPPDDHKTRLLALAQRAIDDKAFRDAVRPLDTVTSELHKRGYGLDDEEIGFVQGYLLSNQNLTSTSFRNKVESDIAALPPGW